MERTSEAADVWCQANHLIKKGGRTLVRRIADKFSEALERGEFPGNDAQDLVQGLNLELPKPDGGIKCITIPDSLSVLFSSIMADRLIRAFLETEGIDKAQKCNIPKTAGCDDNAFLFLSALYEYHAAARRGDLDSEVRIFLFVDMAKAFDRVQWPAINQAIRVILKLPNNMRTAALIKSMYKKTRVIISGGGWATDVEKLGGILQGDPMSPILFIILLELVRRQIHPEKRPTIQLRLALTDSATSLRLELDYADDQIRGTDSAEKAQEVIDSLVEALRTIGMEYNPEKTKVLALKVKEGVVTTFNPRQATEGPQRSRVTNCSIR